MNCWSGIGYIGRDVELRYSTGSEPLAIARFSIGISRGKDKDTDWISCVAFGRTAENIEKFFHKGSQIGVTGRIQTGSYEKDGVKHYTTDVVVDRFDFCGKKDDQAQTSSPMGGEQVQGFTAMNEDIPF